MKKLLMGGLACLTPGVAKAAVSCVPNSSIAGNPITCTAGIVPVPRRIEQIQKKSEWCWATAISMLFDFYGYKLNQDQIVLNTKGGLVNAAGTPSDIEANLEATWIDNNGRSFQSVALTYDAITGISDLNNSDVIAAITNDRPVILGADGHAMLMVALNYTPADQSMAFGPVNWIEVIDPESGTIIQTDQAHSTAQFLAIPQITPIANTKSISPSSPTLLCDVLTDLVTNLQSNASSLVLDTSARNNVGDFLPGFSSCSIDTSDPSNPYVVCDKNDDDATDADTDYQSLLPQIRSCLTQQSYTETNDDNGVKNRSMFDSTNGPTVGITHFLDSDRVTVVVN